MSLLVGVAGLATGYMFVHAGRQLATGGSPAASTLETARTSISPSVEPAEDEPSAVQPQHQRRTSSESAQRLNVG